MAAKPPVHKFIPSKDPSKVKRQLGHVASYYTSKGEPGRAAEFKPGGGLTKGAISRRLKKGTKSG